MAEETDPRQAYQRVLRAIGAFLDQEGPQRFRIIETPDGFTCMLEHGKERPTLQEVQFKREDLADRAEQLARGRKMMGSKYHESWALSATGRQDFLRALGHELDAARARGILIDEIDDGVFVTYSYLAPTLGYLWKKHMIVLQGDQIDTLVKGAHERRQKRGLLRRS